jgi:curved DNA-binding protein CbpA
MRTIRSHYEVLGLPRSATLVQIKRRYRELVRKYHPDVAQDKEMAHRLFIQLTEAYDTLADPDLRRSYDQELEAKERPPSATHSSNSQSASSSHPNGSVLEHLRDAQLAYVAKRYAEAISHCRMVLQLDPRNARAHVVMGDIYKTQGKTDRAISHYSMALQYNPADRQTEKKLMGLMEKERSHQPVFEDLPTDPRRRATANAVAWAFVFFILMLISIFPGTPIPWLRTYIPQVAKWSWNLVFMMGAASLAVGVILSVNGLVRHADDELVFDTSAAGWVMVPTGFILLVGSGFFFIGAAGLYLLIGFLQGSISRSVLIAMAATVGVVLFAAMNYDAARMQVLLFGGNVAFISLLLGWYIGSMFKPLNEL